MIKWNILHINCLDPAIENMSAGCRKSIYAVYSLVYSSSFTFERNKFVYYYQNSIEIDCGVSSNYFILTKYASLHLQTVKNFLGRFGTE